MKSRQYDLDWIRVIATLAVFLYHCSMFFNPFPWHVKNNTLDSPIILAFSLFIGSWLMPIFFAVSGISMVHSLQKRRSSEIIRERLVRLGIPLLFGIFILSPPQVYIERLTHGQYEDTLFSFLPHYFDGLYLSIGGNGNFAFFGMHLWYLLVLIVFTFISLPLFSKIPPFKSFSSLHFFTLPLLLIGTGILHTVNLGGWDLFFYLMIFLYGFYFFANDEFKPALQSTIKWHLTLAALTSVVYIAWFMNGLPQPGSWVDILFFSVHTINCWSWLLCIFYFAEKYLSFSSPLLIYGGEASMPVYVLHQPVIIMIGFWIKDWEWPTMVKLLFLIVISFSIIMICYHFIIQRFSPFRLLFGMRKKPAIVSAGTKISKNQ